jgi:glucose-6-phosphate dehydrogenase assembly protein OpcA
MCVQVQYIVMGLIVPDIVMYAVLLLCVFYSVNYDGDICSRYCYVCCRIVMCVQIQYIVMGLIVPDIVMYAVLLLCVFCSIFCDVVSCF